MLFRSGNIFNIVIMLSFAALGMILYYELPNIFAYIHRISNQRRLKNIDAKLEKLSKEWGNEIISDIIK